MKDRKTREKLTSKITEEPKGLIMNSRIENEINKTLECMGNDTIIEPTPFFVDNVYKKIGEAKKAKRLPYRSRIIYPAAIIVLVAMNLTVLWSNYSKHDRSDIESSNASVMAREYGLNQDSYVNF